MHEQTHINIVGSSVEYKYNHWLHRHAFISPCVCSNGDPSLTIAARYDLNPHSRQLTGAVDGKVVGAADVDSMRVHAISGPSTEVDWGAHSHEFSCV